MTAGLLQLVTKGADDMFLTHDPQITLFKIVYRRCTNFCKVEHVLNFQNVLTFSKNGTINIKSLGDLANKMYLMIDLPDVIVNYYYLTYKKLYDIMSTVGIVFNFGRDLNEIITIDIFNKDVLPIFISAIAKYNELIINVNQELDIVKNLQINYIPRNILRFMGVGEPNILVTNILPKYPVLPLKYKIYLDYIRCKAIIDAKYKTIFNVYSTLYELYNIIDGDKIQIMNASAVKNVLYDTAQTLVYQRKKCINIVPGYQLPYIIGSLEIPKLIQPTFIGENYIIYDSIKKIITNIPIQVKYPLSSYFNNYVKNSGIGIDIIENGNLDLDIYLKKYLAEIDIIDYNTGNALITYDKIISVKNTLLAVLSEVLPNNIKQFIRILEIIRSFRIDFRNNNTISTLTLKYGFFSSMPNIQNTTIQFNNDRNIFFYDNDYSFIKPCDYYNNWVKLTVNNFFNALQLCIQDLKFVPYYTDCSYWSYLSLCETSCENNPCTLNQILKDQYKLHNTKSLENIWLTELIPIVVAQNLYNMFNYDLGSRGIYWGGLFQSNGKITSINRDKYLELAMSQYKMENNIFKLDDFIVDYICCRTGKFGKGPILTNIFCPKLYFDKDIYFNQITNSNLVLLEKMYIDNLFPKNLTVLDILLITVGLDVLCLIDESNIDTLYKLDAKICVIRILHLYIMSYDEIPPYIIQDIPPNRYNPPCHIENYINRNVMSTIFCKYNNNIARISSIQNHINCSQRNIYNRLIINKLLSTDYYRLFTSRSNEGAFVVSPSLCGIEVGIGLTMQQTYELFVSKFFNERLKVSTPQIIPLEVILEKTDFNNIAYYDPLPSDYLAGAIFNIKVNILNGITTVGQNIINYGNILDIRTIDLEPLLYFGSLYKIMSAGITDMEFQIIDNDVLRVRVNDYIPTQLNGYTLKISKNLRIDPNICEIFIGECYKSLGICPLASINCKTEINELYGYNYTSILDSFPCKLDLNCRKIYRGVIDFFHQIRNTIIKKFNNVDELLIFDETLRTCNIYLSSPLISNTYTDNVTIKKIDGSKYSPDNEYRYLFSSINTQGTLFTDLNPIGFNTNEISNLYKSFENPYSIIQYMLDLMIFNMEKVMNFPIIISNNEQTTLLNYELYLLSEKEKCKTYLSRLTSNITCSEFTGSEICMRINNLINNGINKAAKFAWSRYIGFNLINEISISIGGQLLDKHNFRWMYLDYKLNKQKNQERGHNMMIGNIPDLYSYNNSPKYKHKLYVPIQFWFCKNISQSLPMISLQHSEVTFNVKLKTLHEVAYWDEIDTYFEKEPVLNCQLLVDYIYLESHERKKIANAKHEYLIETVQRKLNHGGSKLLNDHQKINNNLDFTNICKYLIWIVKIHNKKMSNNTMREILNWNEFYNLGDNEAIRGFDIKFNDIDRETYKPASYYNLVQPYQKNCSNLPKNVFLYSFALYPKLLQTSGGINVDMLTNFSIGLELSENICKSINQGENEIEFDVYGKQINVLRISNGIGGLVFYGGLQFKNYENENDNYDNLKRDELCKSEKLITVKTITG